ncbi:MAG: selenide, water dikinase SelD, partial [Candidatus Zixiibacteriota bacterium]
MAEALKDIPQSSHPDLIVGFNKGDDAGVYRISDDLALVQTLDFFPPIVDDPYSFGLIAAANALSDVYAMGGTPLTALNIVAFPSDMPPGILTDILRGGNEKVEQAGAVVVGGHSIKDKELKYGVAITGRVHPDRVMTNAGAKAGDRLYLTKPLGTGLITTGIKQGKVAAELSTIVVRQMAQLNRKAAELMLRMNATAATDITGYGLLGHAFEMAEASRVTIRIFAPLLPLLPQALELAEAGMIPGGANANREFLEGRWASEGKLDKNLEHVLFDPQTSGGLLIAIPENRSKQFEQEAESQR